MGATPSRSRDSHTRGLSKEINGTAGDGEWRDVLDQLQRAVTASVERVFEALGPAATVIALLAVPLANVQAVGSEATAGAQGRQRQSIRDQHHLALEHTVFLTDLERGHFEWTVGKR